VNIQIKDASDVFKHQGAATLLEMVALDDEELSAPPTIVHAPPWLPGRNIGKPATPIVGDVPPPFEWALIDASSTWTKDPVLIAAMDDEAIVEKLIRRREVVCVVGQAKTAKTWFSVRLALCISSGTPFLGLRTHLSKVLYLDYELKPETFRKRLSLLSPERPENFRYFCMRGRDRLPRVGELEEMILREGIEFVVVDSMYRTGWLSEENSNDSTSRELASLQRLTTNTGCTLLVVDHTAKGFSAERTAVDSARGASVKGGFFDGILVLRPTDKGDDKGSTYALLDPVLRTWPYFKELPLVKFSWSDSAAQVEKEGDVSPSEVDANGAKIIEVLGDRGKGLSVRELHEATGIKKETLRRRLDAMAGMGRIIREPNPKHSQGFLYRQPDLVD
jgi:KaiC/GvpD/RAD55 family RecA-like ATPase